MSHKRYVALLGLVAALLFGAAGAGPAAAAYPGRDGRIAYTWQEQIYTVTATGSGVKKLTSTALNSHPKWSPDGRRIAFVRETPDGLSNVWVMNANGSNQQKVTVTGIPKAASNVPPTWSPDGAWLLYGAMHSDTYSQYTALVKVKSTAPFGSPVELTGYDWSPASPHALSVDGSAEWSADGRHIIYYSHDYPDSPDNYILSYDTTTTHIDVLTEIGGECCGEGYFADLAVSPSGQAVSYTAYGWKHDSGNPADLRWHTTVVGYDPSTDRFGGSTATGNRQGDRQASFAPGSNRMVLMNGSTGTAKLFIVDASNLASRRFLHNGYQPDWQPLH